ncbi:histidinol-phosphate transaminase [Streptomyces pacificus]|uniref:Histidinol-phosphate aminotransferase n=1 Tax=Streptomyces pacificus TaxID=2705029 RepID=A0A6A0AT91_9ACTN|nr:histidinol-phosphate transaminase [Streptomyces pacificus]GFH34817.1 aminotransferase class I/II-fold pyridoxal phosphate-dependent enzyme [Streptomyces pacificus]
MPGPRPRPELHSIAAHAAGRSAGVPAEEFTHLLAANENPYDPLPGVLDAATAAARRLNRYPDIGCARLIAALAHTCDLPPTRFAAGAGSVGVIQSLIQAMAAPGDEVMHAWRSFEAYPVIAKAICGAMPVAVPLTDDGCHDLDAMAERVTARTRLIFLCTPNNPTGTAVGRDALAEFLARVPEDVLVVLDEAYAEFVSDKDAADGLTVCREHPNVAVVRTFSKAFGLAGLRIGFAVAPEAVAAALRTMAPYGVSRIGQEAAIASLAATDDVMKRVDLVVAERHRMEDALAARGFPVARSQANFLWLPLRERSAEFAGVCARAGIGVRVLAGDGVRVTVGARESNDHFLATAANFPLEPGR